MSKQTPTKREAWRMLAEPTVRFPFGKHGPTVDPVGEHVVLVWQGRRMLGTVTAMWRDEVRGTTMATVRYFNGDLWPLEPAVSALEWIRRDWTEGEV